MFDAKYFKYLIVLVLLFCSSCRFGQNSNNSHIATNRPTVSEIQSEIPFPTKEPEIFQTEIIAKFEDQTEKTFAAQSKGRFFSRKGNVATLQTEANKSFLINFEKKIYVDNSEKTTVAKISSGEALEDFLTTEWLNQKTDAKFEDLGEENGLGKFRVIFENSESLIFVDKNFKIPVRQDYYSLEGETKNLLYSIELQNFKLIAEDNLFEIPKDFRKVSPEEFKKSLKKNNE
jgi:hypothetical protein